MSKETWSKVFAETDKSHDGERRADELERKLQKELLENY